MLLQSNNLHKTYHIKHEPICVLKGAELSVASGESVAVLGRSGAGKSTLLHILGGIDQPDPGSGDVCVDGRKLYRLRRSERTRWRARKIGFIFQTYHLLSEMDVLDNVMLPARALGGRTYDSLRRKAMSLLEAVGVGDRVRHTPLELSGGEQQRVAIARSLINDPVLILADEPTGNLDSETGLTVLQLLFDIIREQKRSLVMVTHNETIATRCDRSLRLCHGLLEPNNGI